MTANPAGLVRLTLSNLSLQTDSLSTAISDRRAALHADPALVSFDGPVGRELAQHYADQPKARR